MCEYLARPILVQVCQALAYDVTNTSGSMQTAGDKMPVLSHFLQLPNICLYQQAEKLSAKHLFLIYFYFLFHS